MKSGLVLSPVVSIRYISLFKHIPLSILFLISFGMPGHSAQQVPTITSLLHQRIIGGDSFRLIADGQIPKPSIESGNNTLKIEFDGLYCRLPKECKGHFMTPVKGKLADRLEVVVMIVPPQTKLTLRLTNGADYSYYYSIHSPGDIELFIMAPDADREQPPADIAPSRQPEVQPPAETSAGVSVPKAGQGRAVSGRWINLYRIVKVEYFPISENGDRFIFTFDGATQDPELELLTYPMRFELTFPESDVQYPVKGKYEPFSTPVPGNGIDKLKVWNRNSSEAGSVFELYIACPEPPKWRIERIPPNKIKLDIFRVNGAPGLETIQLNEVEIELNWPADAAKLTSRLEQMTAGVGAGVVVEIPLKLRLHMWGAGNTIAYPKMEP